MEQIRGEESLFYIEINGDFVPVGCLTDSPMTEDVEMISTTTRENEGWVTELPTNQSYSISLNGLMVKDDEDSGYNIISYRELRGIKRNKVLVNWKRETLNGYYIDSGKAHITAISDADTAGDFITFSATLKGFGKPIVSDSRIYVLGNGNRTAIYTHPDEITVIQTKEI